MSKSIIIDCYPDGSIKMEGAGFKGRECDAEMAVFEKTLGSVKAKQYKGDIHKQRRVSCVENHQ